MTTPLSETLALRERSRREYQFLNPNRIWFQRNERDPNMVAEVCLVNNKYRWRVFDGTSSEHCAEGSRGSLAMAKNKVFEVFRNPIQTRNLSS